MNRNPSGDPTPDDPAACDKRPKRTREDMITLGRIGGYARAASMTEDEMRAQMRRVRAARTARDDARRAAEGLPPRTPAPKPLSDDELVYWLQVADERYPDRVYDNRMQKRRLAVRLARESAARMADRAFHPGTGGDA